MLNSSWCFCFFCTSLFCCLPMIAKASPCSWVLRFLMVSYMHVYTVHPTFFKSHSLGVNRCWHLFTPTQSEHVVFFKGGVKGQYWKSEFRVKIAGCQVVCACKLDCLLTGVCLCSAAIASFLVWRADDPVCLVCLEVIHCLGFKRLHKANLIGLFNTLVWFD